jgi:hypothetical protein
MSSVASLPKRSMTPPGPRSLLAEMSGIVLGLVHNLSDPYRPERHYMRGPGPKWRMKHAFAMRRSAGAGAVTALREAS